MIKRAVVIGTQAEINAWRTRRTKARPSRRKLTGCIARGGILIVEGERQRGVLYGSFALLRLIAEERSLTTLRRVVDSRRHRFDGRTNGTIRTAPSSAAMVVRRSSLPTAKCVRTSLAPRRTRASSALSALMAAPSTTSTPTSICCSRRILRTSPASPRSFAHTACALSLSVDMSSPQVIGGLKTFDPARSGGSRMVAGKVDEIYRTFQTSAAS